MTEEQQYLSGSRILTHTDSQEEVERARAGLGELVDVDQSGYSYDPRNEEQRPNYERTAYEPKPCSFHQILELWAAHEGGRLLRVINVKGKDDGMHGEDDALRAWDWVESVPGWSPTVHEVMRHLVLRNRSWDQWPIAPSVKCARVTLESGDEFWGYCDWPFISKEMAGAAWVPFYRALRKKYRLEPFTIRAAFVEFA